MAELIDGKRISTMIKDECKQQEKSLCLCRNEFTFI